MITIKFQPKDKVLVKSPAEKDREIEVSIIGFECRPDNAELDSFSMYYSVKTDNGYCFTLPEGKIKLPSNE